MLIFYMENFYIFLKMIGILVTISHLYLLVTYLCISYIGEDLLPLENTEFRWVLFYWSAFHLSGLLYFSISWWSISSPPTAE